MLNRRPWGPLCWLSLLRLIQQLLWTPTQSGGPSPFGLVWLSLPHLVYNSVRSLTQLSLLLSWLSYIMVQRPLSRLLDLWNRMLDRRQAEITVMQFRGHSLPVHQSMSAPWEFFLPRPISSSNFRPRDFLSQLPLECVTSFRCITLEWHFWPGRRPKYITLFISVLVNTASVSILFKQTLCFEEN